MARALRIGLAALLLALGLALGTGVAMPRVAVACSCIGPQPLAAYAGPDTVIFSGTVVAEDADGVRVGVERWFSGSGAAADVLIAGDFGNGASCGIGSRPPLGSRWIWVAFRPPEEGIQNPLEADPVQVNICQPFADLSTPEGDTLLAEAVETFGDDGGVGTTAPGDPQIPSPTASTPEIPSPTSSTPDPVLLAAVVAAVVAGVLVLGVALLLGSRRGRGAG